MAGDGTKNISALGSTLKTNHESVIKKGCDLKSYCCSVADIKQAAPIQIHLRTTDMCISRPPEEDLLDGIMEIYIVLENTA